MELVLKSIKSLRVAKSLLLELEGLLDMYETMSDADRFKKLPLLN